VALELAASGRRSRATRRSCTGCSPVGIPARARARGPDELYEYVPRLDLVVHDRRRRSRSLRRSHRGHDRGLDRAPATSANASPGHAAGAPVPAADGDADALRCSASCAPQQLPDRARVDVRGRAGHRAGPREGPSTLARWREPPAQARRSGPRAGGDRPGVLLTVCAPGEGARRRRRDRSVAPVLFIVIAAACRAPSSYQLLAAATACCSAGRGHPITIAALMLAAVTQFAMPVTRARRARRAVGPAPPHLAGADERGGFLAVLYARIVP